MARPWTPIDAVQAGLLAESGYGQGTEQTYKPWLDRDKVWARRPVTSLKGLTTGRVHYLVGELAHPYFYIVEWSSTVKDIREQYPLLPLEETLAIAKHLGVRHPVHGQTRKPVVLVTDYLLTVMQNEVTVQQARALASVASLENTRDLELLEIERRYWEARRVDWGIATERERNLAFANNVDFLHDHMLHGLSSYLSEDGLKIVPDLMVLLTRLVQQETDQPLNQLTRRCDGQLDCPPGTSLTIVYHLLATRQWRIDMHVPINPHRPLHLLAAALNHAEE
jgi:TnsA endonuclease N terminal/TnsA endonuclease C terminal